jgi:hypothetical protein
MLPLDIPGLFQQIIVTAIISIASLFIVRSVFKSRQAKSGSCRNCDIDH